MLQVVTALLFLTVATCQDFEAEAVDYLSQFGYIPTPEDGSRPYVDVTVLDDAVKEFQTFAGLEPTGKLDSDTVDLMKTPRCGKEDRVANFVLQGSNWQKKSLTYRIFKYPSNRGLSKLDVDRETRKAFSMWEKASGLRFEETASSSADIEIRFEKFSHGDGIPFDGPGGVLAHAFYPRFGGDAHFDDSEQWSVTPFVGNQLLNTLTHEFGHSLGLKHSNIRGAIMAPFYKGWDKNLQLGEDDKKGIQALYGPPPRRRPTPTVTDSPVSFTTARGRTTRRPTRFTTSKTIFPTVGGSPDLCGSKLDAAVQTSGGVSYVFSGDSYWKLTSDSIAAGYPRKISEDWAGLPSNLDAAVTWQDKKVTYFFKGDKYWRFTDMSPSPGYPRDIANWPGLPADLDTAFTWGKSEHLYFFKGSQYWKYDTRLNTIDSGYPKSISLWKDLPVGVEAALRWSNGRTYVFKSGSYWRLSDKTGGVDTSNPPFPRDAGQWWFGCPRKTLTLPLIDATNQDFSEEYDSEH